MFIRPLAHTGIEVSAVGLGLVKIGRNTGVKYPSHFELPDDNAVLNLLDKAKDLGVNLLDTAPAYGTSEERLGELLVNRQDWIISSKAGEDYIDGESHYCYTPEHITDSVERSLERLRTDYLDVFLIHSDGNDMENIERYDLFNTLHQLKKSGKVRATGMSTKTVAGGKAVLDHCDICMVAYNPIYTDELSVIEYAAERGKSTFIKKAFASGHMSRFSGEDPVQTAVNFIFAQAGVTSLISGTVNPDHLAHNVACVKQALEGS